MTQPTQEAERAALEASYELARLQAQVAKERAALARLQDEMVEAERHRISSRPGQLVEANERLVLAALNAQAHTDTVTRTLNEVSRAAELDPLTQLPNRVLLLDRFGRAIAGAKRHRKRVALLFVDLDKFKQINDTLGHSAGDEVLKLVAHRLVSSVREADTVSRHGGDEFIILLTDVAQASDAGLVADKVIAALGAVSKVGDHELHLKASIGISIYPDDGLDADQLMDRADAAMYTAKRRGLGGFAFDGSEPLSEVDPVPPAFAAPQYDSTGREHKSGDQERRHAQLRVANEQLVLSAISAQESKSAVEEAQRKHAELLASLVLELHKPLAPIRAAAASLGRGPADGKKLSEVRAVIERQVADMSRLVGNLLKISEANEGKALLPREHE